MKISLRYKLALFFCLVIYMSCAGSKPMHSPDNSEPETHLVPVEKGYAGTSVNAVIFRRNSLFTHDQTQYIAFYDPDGNVTLARRELARSDWEIHTTRYKGDVQDAHNSISIAVDGDGYLHVAWNHHDSPLHYSRSLEPGGLELGEREQLVEESSGHRVTYPEFYRMPEGNLLLMYRDGSSGSGSQVLHHFDVETQTWELLHERLIDGQDRVNPYWQTTIDDSGTLHLSWNWRRHSGVESNHDLAYARSRDGGKTWEKTTGKKYNLPITPETAEYALRIPENSSMMNQTSMAADSQGRPYIVNYWKPEGSEVPQYHLVYYDGAKWQVSVVSDFTQAFDLRGGGTMAPPISRPQIAVDTSGDRDKAFLLFRADERGGKVSTAVNHDLEKDEWQIYDLTDMEVGSWEPGFDTELWQREKKLHIFVQRVGQLDHEQPEDLEPQMVYVLELES